MNATSVGIRRPPARFGRCWGLGGCILQSLFVTRQSGSAHVYLAEPLTGHADAACRINQCAPGTQIPPGQASISSALQRTKTPSSLSCILDAALSATLASRRANSEGRV